LDVNSDTKHYIILKGDLVFIPVREICTIGDKMDVKNSNPLGLIGIIGAIILIVGVFLNWLTVEGLFNTYTWNGLDIFNGAHSLDAFKLKYTFVPLVALICGIAALAVMILPTVANTDNFKTINNILGIVALVLSIVVVVFGILFYTQEDLTEVFKVNFGFWLTMIGGIITLIGGVMPIVKNKLL